MSVNTWYIAIKPSSLLQLVQETQLDPDAPGNYVEGADDEDGVPKLWTERNWFGLHLLLTFGKWVDHPPLGDSIAGGTPLGADYVYENSPIRFFRTRQVTDIAASLAEIDEKALRDSYDVEALNAAQFEGAGEWLEGDIVFLWDTFKQIRDFFQKAQAGGYAVLVYLG